MKSAFCGERGIRTPGTSRYVGFQDRCNRPLCHLSKVLISTRMWSLLVWWCKGISKKCTVQVNGRKFLRKCGFFFFFLLASEFLAFGCRRGGVWPPSFAGCPVPFACVGELLYPMYQNSVSFLCLVWFVLVSCWSLPSGFVPFWSCWKRILSCLI